MKDAGVKIHNEASSPRNSEKMRIEQHLTQQQLADRLGVSSAAILSYENGVREPPLELLCRLATIFSTSTDRLLGRIPPNQETAVRKLENDFSVLLHNFLSENL